jgi:hypothetical protein
MIGVWVFAAFIGLGVVPLFWRAKRFERLFPRGAGAAELRKITSGF